MSDLAGNTPRMRMGLIHAIVDRLFLENARRNAEWDYLEVTETGAGLDPAHRVRVVLVPVPEGISPEECERRIEDALRQ